jgi:polysaccharide export outer membrane protein
LVRLGFYAPFLSWHAEKGRGVFSHRHERMATNRMKNFQKSSGSLNRTKRHPSFLGVFCLCVCALLLCPGCLIDRTSLFDPKPAGTPAFRDVPKETAKSSLPFYFLEPPDIINVEAIHLAPKAPYRLRVFDILAIDVIGTPEGYPITGGFAIEPGGEIKLGSDYGTVKVEGLSVEEAQEAIRQHLTASEENRVGGIVNPIVSVKLARMGDMQQIAGNHTIGPDGYITLGSYGRVYVNGLTVDECRDAIEFHLSKHLEHPQVAVDIFSYNSKAYYVIFHSSAQGERILKYPYTGNENVLDAIANTEGLPPNSSKRMWVARPVGNSHKPTILPVDWVDITAYGRPDTNYQLLPGDRVFVQEDRFSSLDGTLARTFAPFERIMGFMLLTTQTITRHSGNVLQGGGGRGGGGYY